MLRFLIRRGLSAIGLLFVVSIVSFTLIKAPPGDYADYAAALARNQGGLSYEQSMDAARPDPRTARIEQVVAAAIRSMGQRHGAARRFRHLLRL